MSERQLALLLFEIRMARLRGNLLENAHRVSLLRLWSPCLRSILCRRDCSVDRQSVREMRSFYRATRTACIRIISVFPEFLCWDGEKVHSAEEKSYLVSSCRYVRSLLIWALVLIVTSSKAPRRGCKSGVISSAKEIPAIIGGRLFDHMPTFSSARTSVISATDGGLRLFWLRNKHICRKRAP